MFKLSLFSFESYIDTVSEWQTGTYASKSPAKMANKEAFRRHKMTPLREVSKLFKGREMVSVRNLNPYRPLFQSLIVRFGYR